MRTVELRPSRWEVRTRKRCVEVGLVENLEAADQVAFDREDVDHPPLGVEALWRGPVRRVGDDRSEVAKPMHGLDVDVDVGDEVLQSGTEVRNQVARRDRCKLPMIDIDTKSACCTRNFVSVECRTCLRDGRPTCLRARPLRRRGIGRRVPRRQRRGRRGRTTMRATTCPAASISTMSRSRCGKPRVAGRDPRIGAALRSRCSRGSQ